MAPSDNTIEGRAQSQAEDELDEGKRLRPKVNTNLVRRGTGGIRQERAPDSVRVESGAQDSTRAESLNFPGSDPCFTSDPDQSAGPDPRGRRASLSLNLDFLGSDPEFSDQNPELATVAVGRAPDSGFRSLPGNQSPDFFSFDSSQIQAENPIGTGSGRMADPGSDSGSESDLIPVSQSPIPKQTVSGRRGRASLSRRRNSRKKPENRMAVLSDREGVARVNPDLAGPGFGGGEGELTLGY